jgi:hypothetical protein
MGSCRRAIRAAAFAALLAVGGATPAAAAEPVDATVIDAFARIAFGNEFQHESAPRLQKWLRPVRYRVHEEEGLAAEESEFLRAHIERLRRLTGLGFVEAETWSAANFHILFVRRARFEATIDRYLSARNRHLLPRFAATNCIGLVNRDRATLEIFFAVAIVPIDSAREKGLGTTCIAEETTQVLGLLNDSDEVADTLFNDRSAARDLTALDELLLRLLYHPRLRPGMLPMEALAIAREILPELRRRAAAP